jgi:hypothetical protein
MAKHKDVELSAELFSSVKEMSRRSAPDPTQFSKISRFLESSSGKDHELRKTKTFRFQLMHRWLVEHFEPSRVADVGGGKGLLAYLLQTSGWQATVIDPVDQRLPDKYKDIESGDRQRIAPEESVPRIDQGFEMEMGAQFDLLIGMHAHGCNARIIEAGATYGCGFVLFPCCVIDEPFYPPIGVHWLESLAEYATRLGQTVYPFRLNFKGQNIGLCAVGKSVLRRDVGPRGTLASACAELSQRIVEVSRYGSRCWDIPVVSAWLWIFTGKEAKGIPAPSEHRNGWVLTLLGRQFEGKLVSEFRFGYDQPDLADRLRDDLAAYLLDHFEDAEQREARSTLDLVQGFAVLLSDALKLRSGRSGLDAESFAIRGAAIEDRLDSLIDEAKRLSLLHHGASVRGDLLQRRAAMLNFMYSESPRDPCTGAESK